MAKQYAMYSPMGLGNGPTAADLRRFADLLDGSGMPRGARLSVSIEGDEIAFKSPGLDGGHRASEQASQPAPDMQEAAPEEEAPAERPPAKKRVVKNPVAAPAAQFSAPVSAAGGRPRNRPTS